MSRINDPFGRLSQRRKREYDALIKTLEKAGVISATAAAEVRQRSRMRVATAAVGALLLFLILALIIPAQREILALAGIVITLWIGITGLRADQLMQRYIDEHRISDAPAPRLDSHRGSDQRAGRNSHADGDQ